MINSPEQFTKNVRNSLRGGYVDGARFSAAYV